jgi:multiple sugar transport system substrate-binding protein
MKQTVSRRQFLTASGLVAGAAALAACAPSAPAPAAPAAPTTAAVEAPTTAPTEAPPAPAAAVKNLEAWSRMTDVAAQSIQGIIENYNAAHPDVKVTFVYIAQTQGSQADEKLLTAVAGGTPPAVYYADRFTVPQFAYQGFFTDITEQATAVGVTADQYFDFAWNEATYKDHIYALPFDTDTRGLWYNKDIFTEAGLDPEKPPQTLDELKQAAVTLTTKGAGGQITRFGFHPYYDQMWLYTWGFDFKGEFQDPQTKKITFANPNNVKAMEYMKAWADEIGVQDLDAMMAACAGGWSWAVPKGYADVAAAFDVVAYFCGQEGMLKYCKDTYHIPTFKAAAQDPYFRDDPNHAIFMDLLPVSHSRPPIPFGSKLWDLQVTALQDEIPHGTKTPEQALTDIDTTINKDLQDAGFFG